MVASFWVFGISGGDLVGVAVGAAERPLAACAYEKGTGGAVTSLPLRVCGVAMFPRDLLRHRLDSHRGAAEMRSWSLLGALQCPDQCG